MGVPEEIRKIPRPVNTVVIAYGKNKDKYAVKSRIGCRSVNGKKIPVEGPIIGHIIDGKYVALDRQPPSMKFSECDYRRWADIELCCNLSQDLLADLKLSYNDLEAQRTYIIAALRAVEPDVKDYELSDLYEDTWLSVRYPDVGMSRNTVSEHIKQLGRTYSRITEFMKCRTSKVDPKDLLAVDGTLKSDESKVNTFSDFSRKALKKGTKDVSVIYAYDVQREEPICSQVFAGNVIDSSALATFIETNHIVRGLIVGDKGFSYSAAKRAFDSQPDLFFLLPLKRDASVIEKYHMYDFNSSILDEGEVIECRKERMFDGKYLHSFKDPYIAMEEEKVWVRSNPEYDPQDLAKARRAFGTITFITNMDMSSIEAFKAYKERWNIESMFRMYKDILMLDETRVHEDWSVIGTEFINFLSIIMTCRMRKAFSNVECLRNVPYANVLRKLRRATKCRNSDGEWLLRKLTEKEVQVLQELGLLPRLIEIKNPRGRPKKTKS